MQRSETCHAVTYGYRVIVTVIVMPASGGAELAAHTRMTGLSRSDADMGSLIDSALQQRQQAPGALAPQQPLPMSGGASLASGMQQPTAAGAGRGRGRGRGRQPNPAYDVLRLAQARASLPSVSQSTSREASTPGHPA